MNMKSETTADVQNFILAVENHFGSRGLKGSQIRTDNGTEFANTTVDKFYFEKGITHQLTVPYNSSQNGVTERMKARLKKKLVFFSTHLVFLLGSGLKQLRLLSSWLTDIRRICWTVILLSRWDMLPYIQYSILFGSSVMS